MNTEIAQMEAQKEQAKSLMELRDLALKLSNNREFRKLIREQWMQVEAARYVQLSADPSLKPEERADALAMAQATGHLKRWLSVTIRMGNIAENEINDLDAELAVARAEEAHDENALDNNDDLRD
jgi:hypothetical protein